MVTIYEQDRISSPQEINSASYRLDTSVAEPGVVLRELISPEAVAQRTQELGRQIAIDYQGREIMFIVVLNGAVKFGTRLIDEVDAAGHKLHKVDYVKATSYGNGTESNGHPEIRLGLQEDPIGKHVIVVEDIIDTGFTMRAVKKHLEEKGVKSFAVASLLSKPARRIQPVVISYLGFEIPDEFVVGEGMDYDGLYRNQAGIKIRREIPFNGHGSK